MKARILAIGTVTAIIAASSAWAGSERVTFPEGFKDSFTYFMTSERADNNQVRFLYANDLAIQGAREGGALPNGAQFAMEVFAAQVDENGEPVLDSDGKFIPEILKVIAVMEKGEGWGNDYPEDVRNGDWEYAFFAPDGALKADVETGPCMECHLPYAEDDYIIYRDQLDAAAQ